MRLLVDSLGDELRITPQVLMAAAEGESGDKNNTSFIAREKL
jgi:hypothetical protein